MHLKQTDGSTVNGLAQNYPGVSGFLCSLDSGEQAGYVLGGPGSADLLVGPVPLDDPPTVMRFNPAGSKSTLESGTSAPSVDSAAARAARPAE